MTRWAGLTLAVVIAAGAATAWYSVLLGQHHMVGLPEPDFEPKLQIAATIPTLLFAAAADFGRRKPGVLAVVAGLAIFVAALQIAVIRYELSREWSHGTGFFSFIAWLASLPVAAATALVAFILHSRKPLPR